MTRSTIDYGIDLGTTNSEIALFNGGGDPEIIKNIEGFENTPSAVWIDSKNRLYVGKQAKEKVEVDEGNAKQEFKRQMGKAEPIEFSATGRKMKPEELSAEVLKQLKKNVEEWKGEQITAAVITVPADFSTAAIEATNRAAQLAGLTVSPLVQEPVAAAMAYGFQADSDKVRWLIYDFGGGTFDAALIHMRDGMIRVENHGGDKYLGGKDIDYAIVDDILAPAVRERFATLDFYRDNRKYFADFAKLKMRAEEAKIRLSRSQSEIIDLSDLSVSQGPQADGFEFELCRPHVEQLAEPFIAKSVNICRDVLAEARLTADHIEKVILVGGPTLMPFLRQYLADKTKGLGIALEFSKDPFTVVARGAAVFAATQPLIIPNPPEPGEYNVNLDYRAIGPDVEPLVSGAVVSPNGEDLSKFTIEFVNKGARPPWRSGKLGLSPEGRFMATLWAEKGKTNTFLIELADETGTRQIINPEDFPYTVGGGVITNQPLIHSIGVALADNTVAEFFKKGTPLPARYRRTMKTTVDVRAGKSGEIIRIPVIEGENSRADRNEVVGSLDVPAHNLRRDLPVGSEIDIVIEVDDSRRFLTRAYVPLLDEEFEATLIKTLVVPGADELDQQVKAEKARLASLREKAKQANDAKANELLARIDGERLEHEVDRALAASRNDHDSADKCASRLRDLQIALDQVEDALRWPELVAQAEKTIELANDVIKDHGTAEHRTVLNTLVSEVREAINQRDQGLLHTRQSELGGFWVRIYRETPECWVGSLANLEDKKGMMRDREEAERLFSQGVRAMNENDLDGLRAAVQQLWELLPPAEKAEAQNKLGSTVDLA